MAIFFMRTSIIKASSGKSAVASAAYQAAESLKSERLDHTFSYTTKEEVVFSEVLLPKNAPPELADRAKLWNAVEKAQNRENSRYARQIIIAVPNEWSKEESIERMHEFIKTTFVDDGMAVDWALHYKKSEDNNASDNVHVHVMCTVRSFNENGTWASMEKKEYVLDKDGQKVPEIDEKTGEQKVRVRIRNGHESIEKLYKRITVQANTWNSREQMQEWKRDWAEYANQYLKEEEKIDYRSYKERGIDRLPQVHEGPGIREAVKRGFDSFAVKENEERKAINNVLDTIEKFWTSARDYLERFKQQIIERKQHYDERRSEGKDRYISRNCSVDFGLSRVNEGDYAGIRFSRSEYELSGDGAIRISERGIEFDEAYQGISEIRGRLSDFIERNRAVVSRVGDLAKREQVTEKINQRIKKITERREKVDERARLIRETLMGRKGRADSGATSGGAGESASFDNSGGQYRDTETLIREARAITDRAISAREYRETERDGRKITEDRGQSETKGRRVKP